MSDNVDKCACDVQCTKTEEGFAVEVKGEGLNRCLEAIRWIAATVVILPGGNSYPFLFVPFVGDSLILKYNY